MKVERNISLKKYTTFRIGGPADYFVRVNSISKAKEALRFAREKRVPFFIFGGGSNILASDSGFRGLVIKVELEGVSFKEDGERVLAVVSSGENWDAFVKTCVERGLWGVENLSGIPGTVGGTPVQNVGAYGVEVGNCIEQVDAIDAATLKEVSLSAPACRFGYRDSFFKSPEGKRYVITAVHFRLEKTSQPVLSYRDLAARFAAAKEPTLSEIREAVLSVRARKFPDLAECGTAGSFFKNPVISSSRFAELRIRFPNIPGFDLGENRVKVPLAWILDALSLKGKREGDVGAFGNQPLVLVNYNDASAKEVNAFAEIVASLVQKETGISVEREVLSL